MDCRPTDLSGDTEEPALRHLRFVFIKATSQQVGRIFVTKRLLYILSFILCKQQLATIHQGPI